MFFDPKDAAEEEENVGELSSLFLDRNLRTLDGEKFKGVH